MLVGGEDHKSGQADIADDGFRKVGAWARELISALGEETHRWSGQVLDTVDYADRAYLRRTGRFRSGLTHGVAGAMLNSALIMGESHPWQQVYTPGRVPLKASKNFLMENATALKSFAEYVATGELSSLDTLEQGQGAIVRHGLAKVAAYRDNKGALHLNSASCSHVGWHLRWNSFETCWDCPYHGSMFDIDGAPINAPAVGPLGKIEQ